VGEPEGEGKRLIIHKGRVQAKVAFAGGVKKRAGAEDPWDKDEGGRAVCEIKKEK